MSYNKCEMCSLQKTINNRLHEARRHGGGVRRVLSLECLSQWSCEIRCLTRSYKAKHATVGLIKDYHGSKKKGDLLIMKLDNAIVNGPTIVALQNYLSQKMLASLLQHRHQRHLEAAKSKISIQLKRWHNNHGYPSLNCLFMQIGIHKKCCNSSTCVPKNVPYNEFVVITANIWDIFWTPTTASLL